MNVPLELTGLTKVFDTATGPFIAVKDVNAMVAAGEFVALLGHSGCGKSTVLSMIAGLQRAIADRYLGLVGVADVADQLPGELSLGTQQCVSLARALATEPRFLLLDEPFSQLDSLTRFELQDILLRVWRSRAKPSSW
jgi:ABC-type nitrate/sulfonate/bicarbonate transport system ATPase subunit